MRNELCVDRRARTVHQAQLVRLIISPLPVASAPVRLIQRGRRLQRILVVQFELAAVMHAELHGTDQSSVPVRRHSVRAAHHHGTLEIVTTGALDVEDPALSGRSRCAHQSFKKKSCVLRASMYQEVGASCCAHHSINKKSDTMMCTAKSQEVEIASCAI